MNTTYYFSHDYNASEDHKILFLRQQLGMEGVGIFWYIIEKLANAKGKLPLKIIPVLAMQMQVTETKVQGVINNFDLFKIEGDKFCSNRLNIHLNQRESKSIGGKKGALERWKNKSVNKQVDSLPIGLPNGYAIGLPNAKEKKRKEKKESIVPTFCEFLEYAKTRPEYKPELDHAIKTKYDSWVANDWHDGNGAKIERWKGKLISTLAHLKPIEVKKELTQEEKERQIELEFLNRL